MKLSKRDIGVVVFAASLVVLFIAVISVVSSDMKADPPRTRATGPYEGPQLCTGGPCHDVEYDTWKLTPHARAWDTLNTSAEKKDWCEVCHTTGANDTDHDGFNITTDQPEKLKNVSCEACHGPAPMDLTPASLATDYSSDVCGTCHRSDLENQTRTYHPYYDEWVTSKHASSLAAAGGIVVTDPNCQGCHVAQYAVVENIGGGTVTLPISDPQPITCSVCHDPHDDKYPSQLRLEPAELCATCHNPGVTTPGDEIRHPQSSMREGTSGIDSSLVPKKDYMKDIVCSDCHLYSTGPPQNLTGHSFSFKEEACAACHTNNPLTIDLSVDEAGASVNAVQTETQTLQTQTITDLANARSMIDNATRYGFEISTIDLAEDYYEEASYALDFVIADKSQGAHNPQYAWALLNFASERSNLVKSILLPGTVTGEVVDSDGKSVAGVIVRRGGLDLAVSGSDGSFTFEYASGTYDFSLVKDGELVGTIEDLTIEGGLTVSAGENEISFSTPFDWSIPLLAIIAILVVVVLFLAFKQFGRKQEEESSEEQEEEEKEEESSDE